MSKTFVYGAFHFIIALVFLLISIFTKKSFKVTTRSIPFIIFEDLYIFHFYTVIFSGSKWKWSIYSAWYQPLAPALTSFIAFFMGYEQPTKLKIVGLSFCIIASMGRLIYDLEGDVYKKMDQFRGKFYIFGNILFYAIGVLIQKKIVYTNPRNSLMVIWFYIFASAFIMNMFLYIISNIGIIPSEGLAHII